MKNRHNFEFSPKTMLVFLTIICILLLSVSAVLKDAVKPLSAVAETVVIPMQDGINSFGVWVGDHAGSFKSMKELKKENAKLNEKVRELTQENETLSTNEKELNNLQKLLKIDKAYSQYKKVGARVISKGSGNWYNTFVINKGSKDGIKVNMNVIADGGLVGIVTETGRTEAPPQKWSEPEPRNCSLFLSTVKSLSSACAVHPKEEALPFQHKDAASLPYNRTQYTLAS